MRFLQSHHFLNYRISSISFFKVLMRSVPDHPTISSRPKVGLLLNFLKIKGSPLYPKVLEVATLAPSVSKVQRVWRMRHLWLWFSDAWWYFCLLIFACAIITPPVWPLPSKNRRKQSRNGRFMRDLAQEHSGTCTQSLSTRRKIISSVRPRHIIKRRWRSCTQTAVKHKPLRIGRTCARMGEISSASVGSQSDVFVRKERVWRKH